MIRAEGAWPCILPCYGPPRIAAIRGLQAAIRADCWKSAAAMVADGWDSVDAFRAYEHWLLRVVDEAMAEAVRDWRAGIAA